MADTENTETVEPNTDAKPVEGEQSTEEVDLETLQAELDKWKANSKKNESRAKENFEARKERDEMLQQQEAQQKEYEEQRAALAAERDDALSKVAIYQAVVEHGLDAEYVDFLEGVPADQVNDRAQKLATLAQRATAPKHVPDPNVGRETPPGGGNSGDFLRNAFNRR